jgi:hypothetical protein
MNQAAAENGFTDATRWYLLQHDRRVDKILLMEIVTNDANTACFMALALREPSRAPEQLLRGFPNYIAALCDAAHCTTADLVPRIQLELLMHQLRNPGRYTPYAMACYLCEIRNANNLSLEPRQLVQAYRDGHPESAQDEQI